MQTKACYPSFARASVYRKPVAGFIRLFTFFGAMVFMILVGCSGGETTVASGSPGLPSPSDTTAPTISSVSVNNVTTTSATITWTTNESSSTQVQYGTTTIYGSSVNGTANVTSHSVNLTGLTAGTTYHYRVVSADTAGNSASSGNAMFTSGASGSLRAFCETQSVVYCNGLENANPPEADSTFALMDPYSSGRQTTTYLADGYSNPQILGTGALRFSMHDGGEDDTGISYPNGTPVNLPTQLNVGFVFRLGPNYLAPHLEGAKFIMAYGTTRVRGWRPTVFLHFVTDTEGRVGPAGSRYAVLMAGDDGAGYVSDEFGQPFAQDAYAAGLTHTFRLDNYVGQWVYVEWEVRAQGTHRLYVATRDGVFRGREGEPLAQIASAIVPESLPWTIGRPNAYTEAMLNATTDTYVDVDLLRLNNAYMGPPPGFFD